MENLGNGKNQQNQFQNEKQGGNSEPKRPSPPQQQGPPQQGPKKSSPQQRPHPQAADKTQLQSPQETGKSSPAPKKESAGQEPGATRIVPPDEPQSPAPPPSAGVGAEGTVIVPPEQQKAQQKPKPRSPKAPQSPAQQAKPSESSGDSELDKLRAALAGKYEITKKLGQGGMASVYHAREIALDREVAIKLLPQSYVRDKQFVERFKREAQVAANLEHPHIVRIYQISEQEDLVYFVMSYIPGGALSDQVKKKGPIPVDQIVQWGMDTASALGYAHDHGVIHRDLKPDNIMLDKSNRAIVMDYGIARAGQGTGLTQTGAVIGTPQFMSPEQARGLDLDARSDLYSMGLVLYQLATGSLPFEAKDAASLMYMHVHETPEAPDVRNKEVPAWLRDIILKCLAKNPDDRFASAKELRLALAEHKAPELTEKTIVQRRAGEKKSSAVGMIAIAAIIAIAAAGGWFWWQSQEKTAHENVQPTATAPVSTDTKAPSAQAPAQPQVSADDLAFQQAEMINTKQAFSTYLDKYPDGSHAVAARDMIGALDEAESKAAEAKEQADRDRQKARDRQAAADREAAAEKAQEAAKADDDAFSIALAANNAQAFTTYLQQYPSGRHVSEARDKITALNAVAAEAAKAEEEETARRDDAAFKLAADSGTKEAFQTYLISFPAGKHADEAKATIAAIDKNAAFEEDLKVKLSALSISMVSLPAGSFQMGSANGGKDEKPVRTVSVSGFSISTTEVTQAQFKAVMNDNPSFHKLDDNAPVEKVTFKDAIEYCNGLSKKLGLDPCYDTGTGKCDFTKNGFRLPTEAEWEYACRGGNGAEYNTGNGESALARAAWYSGNSQEMTHPVAQKTANTSGLYDMHGNVWEWTNDWYSERSYEIDGTDNPTGVASGKEKVLRGGGWLDYPQDCTSSKRRKYDPDKSYSDIGFRIVRR